MKNFLHLMLLLVAAFAVTACSGIPDDDDDSSDDDDSATDDDDIADDDDSADDDDDDDSAIGDDDDSAEEPDPELELSVVEIACVDEVAGRDLTSTWTITVDVLGWLENPVFFMWDQFAFDNYHYIDSTQPWIDDDWTNPDFTSDPYTDTWTVTFEGYDDIGEAEAADGTVFRCYDSGGNLQIEEFNFMLCATDFFYGDESCAFIGFDFGAMAGTTANPMGTVGGFDDGAGNTWDADVTVTPDDDSAVLFSPSNPD